MKYIHFQCVALLRRGTQSHAAQHLPNICHDLIPIIYRNKADVLVERIGFVVKDGIVYIKICRAYFTQVPTSFTLLDHGLMSYSSSMSQ